MDDISFRNITNMDYFSNVSTAAPSVLPCVEDNFMEINISCNATLEGLPNETGTTPLDLVTWCPELVLDTCGGNWSNFSSMQTTSVPVNEDYKDFYTRAQFVTGLICYPILCLFGLAGNIVSLIVLNQRKMTSSTNVYLIALAISDSIKLLNDSFYVLCTLLLTLNPVHGMRAYGALYPYAHYFFNMSVCITAWLTVSVAAERYILVCHATKARALCSVSRARLISASVFLSMSVLTIPFALRYRTVRQIDPVSGQQVLDVKVTDLWSNSAFANTVIWTHNMLRSVLPLLVLCTLNYFIVAALRRTKPSPRKLTARHRITLMLLSVILVFVICVTPDAIMSTFFGFGYYEADYLVRGVREITDMLLTVNSAVNFVLYCTFNTIFRRSFVLMFCKCKKRPLMVTEDNMQRSSFITFRGTVLHGSNRTANQEHQEPLCTQGQDLSPL